MPSNKTISIFIICLSVVVSVWLFSGRDSNKNIVAENNRESEVVPAIQIEEGVNDDWKKILTNVDKKTSFEDLTQNLDEDDDTTLTDQLSRDFMSQYLLAVKSGEEINSETANTIAKNTLLLPEYNYKSVVYIRQNLKVVQKSDADTMRKYKEGINEALQIVYHGLKDDPMTIVINAISTEKESDIQKLDPIIKINKATVKYLLEMEVPEKAVVVHLELLNISSAILSDLEGMRVGLEDPIKIFGAMGNYAQNSANFAKMLTKMNEFLSKIS